MQTKVCSIETLVGGIIPRVTEKKWVWISNQISKNRLFSNFLSVGILMQGSEILLPQPNHPLQMPSFRLGPWWKKSSLYLLRSKCSKYNEKNHDNLRSINFWLSGFWCEEQNRYFSKKQFTTSGNYRIGNLIGTLNMSLQKIECQNQQIKY